MFICPHLRQNLHAILSVNLNRSFLNLSAPYIGTNPLKRSQLLRSRHQRLSLVIVIRLTSALLK